MMSHCDPRVTIGSFATYASTEAMERAHGLGGDAPDRARHVPVMARLQLREALM